ncbi:MAG: chemotaxis protein CheW [Planctomycetota bacterium]|nr:chemotaxis protein CheW [Planctomycetota bacterium]
MEAEPDRKPTGDLQAEDHAAHLLSREPAPAYLDAWSRALRRELEKDDGSGRFGAGVIKVGEELFAVPTENVVEVHPLVPIRTLPGRATDVFRGLVSLRGEIHLCVSLHALFGLDAVEGAEGQASDARRLLVVRSGGERWALLVDAVLDFERFDPEAVRTSQVTVAKSAVHFTNGVIQTPAGPAALIEPRRLFEGLSRSLS